MIIFDASIRKCKAMLAEINTQIRKIENTDEDNQIADENKLHELISQIDTLIEGDYAKAVFSYYIEKKPVLIHIRTGEEVQWLDAFGASFDTTTPAQRHALVGLIEGGSKYQLK